MVRLLSIVPVFVFTVLFTAGCEPLSEPVTTPEVDASAAPAAGELDAATETRAPLKPTAYPIKRELTEAERAAYGSRAALFVFIEESWGIEPPPLNWRDGLGGWLAEEDAKWSQCYEELAIRDFFDDRKGGFFLDAGCYLPRNNSTTFYLEDELHWTGIGVDVISAYGEAWAVHRPNSKFISRAVSDTDGEEVTLFVRGAVASLEKELAQGFLEGAGLEKDMEEVQVTTITLDTILEQANVERLDFLSVDIEGVELAALRGFDIRRWKPELCCIASQTPDPIMAYFESNGYRLIEKYRKVDTVNFYFCPAENG